MPEKKNEGELEIAYVLLTDIIGYSRLSTAEQRAAIDSLNRVVRATEAFQQAEAAHRLTKLPTGDGMALVFYSSPEEPAACALEISRALQGHPRLRLRMGIHSGPVSGVIDLNGQANVAGAGINMAQRIMDCGDAGHILLSRHAAEDLEHFPRWKPLLHALGECTVKHGVRVQVANLCTEDLGNRERPTKFIAAARRRRMKLLGVPLFVAGVLAALLGILFPRLHAPRATPGVISEKSIAVLPFENLSDDKANAYFAAGIQDEILTRLANLGELKVISRTSTERYQSHPSNLQSVANELGVANILEGSVQKLANDVHINVQLIRARSDTHLWAQSYDRTLEHAFAVEGEVAQTVANSLKVALQPPQIEKLHGQATKNPQANDLFLRGEYVLHQAWKNPGDYQNTLVPAISYYREALAADPQFALAYAHLAYAELTKYRFAVIDGGAQPLPELLRGAKDNIDHALLLNPDLGAAHEALGYWHYWGEGDYAAGVAEFNQALSLDPHLSDALEGRAAIAQRQGHPGEAIAQLSRELEVDPRNVELLRELASGYEMQGDFDVAIKLYQRSLSIDPANEIDAHNLCAALVLGHGDIPGAFKVVDALPANLQGDEVVSELKIFLFASARDYRAAEKLLQSVPQDRWRTDWSRWATWGDVQKGLGNQAEARASFSKAEGLLMEAIARDPGESETHAVLGQVEAELGKGELALREAQRAVDLTPITKDADTGAAWLRVLAQVNAQLGHADEAVAILERVRASNAGLVTAWTLKLNAVWDPIRTNPRFQKLVASLSAKG